MGLDVWREGLSLSKNSQFQGTDIRLEDEYFALKEKAQRDPTTHILQNNSGYLCKPPTELAPAGRKLARAAGGQVAPRRRYQTACRRSRTKEADRFQAQSTTQPGWKYSGRSGREKLVGLAQDEHKMGTITRQDVGQVDILFQ
ncbi:uncharacterized protein MELLADRAFT_108066 [Melampsora larici-populina 98AG31]|uniref:Uncharacterized protein n=1 Tax=Melampsora larici-populina (strain 98AG31 / pathotype 3-4-7) TaxID=747676 RepID=F4RRV0_MELLP|nr:uncharacterized protein MELLADRAFT_108066 [Melampsora larici-populina 98AG31]EGG04890.1 hypothetical protein MELLADRAFT_108066 [Melampsora larici-populina 98AG31]